MVTEIIESLSGVPTDTLQKQMRAIRGLLLRDRPWSARAEYLRNYLTAATVVLNARGVR